MGGWECPSCRRRFGRTGQGHECAPAVSIEEYFSTGPRHERPVFDALMARLADVGPIDVEPVSVGVFLKRDGRRFAELRPRDRWVALSFSLRRRAQHPTITRKVLPTSGRFWHTANVRSPEDLDDDLVALLAEAYVTR